MTMHARVVIILATVWIGLALPADVLSESAGQALFLKAEGQHEVAQTNAERQAAVRTYERALAAFTKARDGDGSRRTLLKLGVVFQELNNHGKALDYFERSCALARKSGNEPGEADCLLLMSDAAENAGRGDEAIAFSEQALALYDKLGDIRGQARGAYRAAVLLQARGTWPRALELFERVVEQARVLKDNKLELSALDCRARLSEQTGSFESALESYKRMLDRYRRIGDIGATVPVLNRLGDLSKDLARWSQARDYYNLALEACQERDDPTAGIDSLTRLGLLDMHLARYPEAIEHLEQALSLSEKEQQPASQLTILTNLGYVYRDRGQYSRASYCFARALTLAGKTGDKATHALLLTNLGWLCLDWGRHDQAMACFQEALKLSRTSGDQAGEAQNLLLVGRVLAAKRQMGKSIEHLRQARTLLQSMGAATREVDAILGGIYLDLGDAAKAEPLIRESGSNAALGRLHLCMSEFAEAVERYQDLLQSGEQSGRMDDVVTAHTGLGLAYEGLGDLGKAETHFTKALEATEELRSTLMPAARRSFLAAGTLGLDRSEPARGLTRVLIKQGRAEDSIVPGELARARAFADRLALGPDAGYSGVPLAVQQEEATLIANVAVLKELRTCCTKEENPERYKNLTGQIEEAQRKVDAFVEMLWKDYRPYAAVKHPRPLNRNELKIPETAYVIVFDLLGEGVAVKLFRGNDMLTAEYVPWKSVDLEAAVRKFRDSLERVSFADFDVDLGKTLYSRLISPVIAFVPKETPLAIVPDGVLAILPFEALVVEGSVTWKQAEWGKYPFGLVYFGDVHPLTYFPSLTSLSLHAAPEGERTDGRVLVFADPVFGENDSRAQGESSAGSGASAGDLLVETVVPGAKPETGPHIWLPRLEETEELARRLHALFPDSCAMYTGLKASKETFLQKVGPEMDRYPYVVLATHGIYGTEIPGIMEPVLCMTMVPPGTDGYLRMSDVMSLSMDAELVVLAGCQTALGEYISGEGVMSIGSAFRYAGARSVLMSLWSVEETATVKLVEQFLQHVKEGKSRLEALAQARADIRSLGYEHPFFWSAFVLNGGLTEH